MRPEDVRELMAQVAAGDVTPDEAVARLASLPFVEVGPRGGVVAGGGAGSEPAGAPDAGDAAFARVDHHRELRTGFPETIFCQGKTPEQVARIAAEMLERGPVVLATRADDEQWEALRAVAPDAERSEIARVMWVDRRAERPAVGHVLVTTGGTADIPVAEEAAVCAEIMGNRVTRLFDVGVAGVHRLLANRERLDEARVIVAVAGMEGALPSLVAGLVGTPVVAVPTSVGYGATFGGLAALLTMITSCAPGIGVVNIDNGFGAAALASRINRPGRGRMIGYLDCFSGVSGDKFLGALVDAGLDLDVLREASDAVLPGEVDDHVRARALGGDRRDAGLASTPSGPQPARRWAELRELIAGRRACASPCATRSLAVFEALAQAEARVHGVAADDVHFHEVGAVDSVADIVGTCAGLEALGVTRACAARRSPSGPGPCARTTACCPSRPPPPRRCSRASRSSRVPPPESSPRPPAPRSCACSPPGSGRCPTMTPVRSGYGAGTRELRDADGRGRAQRAAADARASARASARPRRRVEATSAARTRDARPCRGAGHGPAHRHRPRERRAPRLRGGARAGSRRARRVAATGLHEEGPARHRGHRPAPAGDGAGAGGRPRAAHRDARRPDRADDAVRGRAAGVGGRRRRSARSA